MKTSSLVVIPSALLVVDGMDELEEWMPYLMPTTTATLSDEIRALNDLHRTQFVRRNVSPTFTRLFAHTLTVFLPPPANPVIGFAL